MDRNIYETIIIFDPTTDTRTINSFKDMCQRFTGDALKIKFEDMGEKELAYPFKRDERETKRGHFIMIIWKGIIANVSELERHMRLRDEVLKFMTVKREDEELEEYESLRDEFRISSELEPATTVKSEQDAWDKIFNSKGE